MATVYIATSLEDIARVFNSLANAAETQPTESTRAAQSYRNGKVAGIRDCASMLNDTIFQPRAMLLAAMNQLKIDQDAGKIKPQFELPTIFLDTAEPKQIAQWLYQYIENYYPEIPSPPARVFSPQEVRRKNSGGTLYAPVDQHGRESGDTPSYDQAAIAERCRQLNGRLPSGGKKNG